QDEGRREADGRRQMAATGDREFGNRGLGERRSLMTSSRLPIPDSRSPSPGREGQTFGGSSRWVTYANFVKLPHTIFALPFALVGVVLASYDAPVRWLSVVWVVAAFTAARFAAM